MKAGRDEDGNGASRERLGPRGAGRSERSGARPLEMAPDGPGLPPRPPFSAVSAGLPGWRDCERTPDAGGPRGQAGAGEESPVATTAPVSPAPGQRRQTGLLCDSAASPPGGEGLGAAGGRARCEPRALGQRLASRPVAPRFGTSKRVRTHFPEGARAHTARGFLFKQDEGVMEQLGMWNETGHVS